MTTRRAPTPTVAALAAPRGWPPVCGQCGFVGAPDDKQSPYLACHGDPARHQRKPLRRTRAFPDHEAEAAAAPAVPAATAGSETTRPTAATTVGAS